ncbi:D-alanine--D-alanine ligase A [Roseivirga misakiensis]|uniref:D-alanine--D-alanine ligase n=2 Tax=Roseivirga misakiensis TaxID=1563681 RepID=A0A1E5T2P2_9BACT|nr:D-alanine--D-alanine ligase A [Roseivirga misakiensis]
MSKLNLAVVYGGKSTEHEISILSTKSILKYLDQSRYNISLVYIDINGHWFLKTDIADEANQPVTMVPSPEGAQLIDLSSGNNLTRVDVAFPVLHGLFGEDGTIQGFFKMVNVPFVGCGVMASSACMDKDMTKRVLRDCGIGIAPYMIATPDHKPTFQDLEKQLGMPIFIKPANLGSSVGVFKVSTEAEYKLKIEEALGYDHKVLIETTIVGKEVECAVLGNDKPKASLPGEVVMETEFYDFESKYVDKDASSTLIPADISQVQIDLIRETAVKAYSAMGCEGLARVDFFVTEKEEVLINEINTIPGFTNISMYPKMWEATGIPYSELLDILIELGIERFKQEQELRIHAKAVE